MKKNLVLIGVIIAGYLLFIGSAVSPQPAASEQVAAAETVENNLAFAETRCGWYSNPTPGNHWLNDRDGEWIIGTQGGHQAEGDYPPAFKKGQWIKTNVNYGYGCACLTGTFNSETRQAEKITKATARPLAACRKDKALKEPKD